MRLALLVALMALPAAAIAGSPTPEAYKKRAFEHFSHSRWAEGIVELELGYDLSKNSGFLYNKAVAFERWPGHCKEAIAAYESFLTACGACGKHLVAKDRLALVKLSCGQAKSAAPEIPKEQLVEGWADVNAGKAEARRRAILDAQRRAVEAVAGIHLRIMMNDQSFSAIQDSRERFGQEIDSRIYSRSEGFIRSSKVIDEVEEEGVYKVTLHAVVADSDLARALTSIARRLADARFPKIMFVVKEQYTGRDGKTIEVEEPTLQALLEDELLARGFDLVAKEQLEALWREEASVLHGVFEDDAQAAALGVQYGAEYVVTASARVRFQSFDDFHQGDFHGHAELSLKAINASTAALIASDKKSGPSPASCFSEADLRIRTVRHVAPPLVDGLVERIADSWDREQTRGIRYSVRLHGVKSYSKEASAFLDLLRRLTGVVEVRELSYAKGRLDLEVFYPPQLDVSHLLSAILAAAKERPPLRRIDVELSKGRQLNLVLP